MEDNNTRIANTILQQMGGANRLSVMIGVRQLVSVESGVRIKFSAGRDHNLATITLGTDDLYTMTLSKWSGRTMKHRNEVVEEGLYADMLVARFEAITGLYLSL